VQSSIERSENIVVGVMARINDASYPTKVTLLRLRR